ncbi:uncharacterized protein BKA55DRAFT_546225 [Fusarium redolens]|uniref:Uncharacterized protein n=1 Tax=Fusarium redolens TaxID=48865 RepID=A0A9P9FYP9_FUSRE|nr:uncharacterized protein BKA55DRAFT_546225 [Fusarium redolens]KAH7220443.1 hypothetical protein BKA55DRAFT_546225 [Fusarium redolens]
MSSDACAPHLTSEQMDKFIGYTSPFPRFLQVSISSNPKQDRADRRWIAEGGDKDEIAADCDCLKTIGSIRAQVTTAKSAGEEVIKELDPVDFVSPAVPGKAFIQFDTVKTDKPLKPKIQPLLSEELDVVDFKFLNSTMGRESREEGTEGRGRWRD